MGGGRSECEMVLGHGRGSRGAPQLRVHPVLTSHPLSLGENLSQPEPFPEPDRLGAAGWLLYTANLLTTIMQQSDSILDFRGVWPPNKK